MLIDSAHRRWFVSTVARAAVAGAGYWWLDRGTPGGLTGGSIVGLWYGIIGSALMVYTGLLSALRKVPSWWWIGSRTAWLKGHIWLGLLSGVVIGCHSGCHWEDPWKGPCGSCWLSPLDGRLRAVPASSCRA